MSLENTKVISSSVLDSLEDAKILAGANYDLKNEQYNPIDSCDRCDCVCNQPCHGEGPCYSL